MMSSTRRFHQPVSASADNMPHAPCGLPKNLLIADGIERVEMDRAAVPSNARWSVTALSYFNAGQACIVKAAVGLRW